MCPHPPELPFHLPPHHIPPGCHRTPALGILSHKNFHWLSVLHMVMCVFQCYSLKSSHSLLFPLSPKVYFYVCVSFVPCEVSQKEKGNYCILMHVYGIQKDDMDALISCFTLGSVYMLIPISHFCLRDFSFSLLSWLFVSVLLFPLGWKCMVSFPNFLSCLQGHPLLSSEVKCSTWYVSRRELPLTLVFI